MTVTSLIFYVALILVASAGALIEVSRILFVVFSVRGVIRGEVPRYRESIKTSLYTLVGWVIAGCAAYFYLAAANVTPPDINDRLGEALFDDFEPIDVKRLDILRFDDEDARYVSFRVEQQGIEMWTIPSHNNYPADAVQRVQNASNSLINLTVLDVVPMDEVDEELFGVIEPAQDDAPDGAVGMGVLVTLRDRNQRELASLIVGKPLRDEPSRRFVRIPGQDPVYIVEFDISNLTTDFGDWITRNLLILDQFNVTGISVDAYQVNLKPQADPQDFDYAEVNANDVTIVRDYEFNAVSEFSLWKLLRMVEYPDQSTPRVRELQEGERLDFTKLESMKQIAGNLQIIDVERKPAGLSANLTTGMSFIQDDSRREERRSLASHGFYPIDVGNGIELLSSNGEVVIQSRGGIEYVLRFGKIRTDVIDQLGDGKLQRYMMVTARVNEDAFQVPIRGQSQSGNDDTSNSGNAPPPPPGGNDSGDGNNESDGAQDDVDEEYQNQVNQYNDQIAQANRAVDFLNQRFADWYYVISEDAYTTFRVDRQDLIVRGPTTQ